MRTSFAARAAAVLATAAVSLTIAAPPATAVETPATFTTFKISSNVITDRPSTQFFGTVETSTTSSPIVSATTRVAVNGVVRGTVPLILGTGNGGVDVPRVWGAGEVRLGPTTFTYADGTTSTTTRVAYFNARRDIKVNRADNVALTVKRSGDRLRFRVKKLTVIVPTTGRYTSLRKVRLQSLRNGSWRDVARIKLNRAGNGSASFAIAKKYRYRLISDQSATQVGFTSARTGKI